MHAFVEIFDVTVFFVYGMRTKQALAAAVLMSLGSTYGHTRLGYCSDGYLISLKH